ncbi:hypothetical protein [Burkholderia pseudomallei]|uniref:hypothetical protein n=1 Tax=Burkholderia pseudomallei TaxID=28450 RepID=UPI001EE20C7E|nr:hypothetical protein [Burkholderia pseudomallei]
MRRPAGRGQRRHRARARCVEKGRRAARGVARAAVLRTRGRLLRARGDLRRHLGQARDLLGEFGQRSDRAIERRRLVEQRRQLLAVAQLDGARGHPQPAVDDDGRERAHAVVAVGCALEQRAGFVRIAPRVALDAAAKAGATGEPCDGQQ